VAPRADDALVRAADRRPVRFYRRGRSDPEFQHDHSLCALGVQTALMACDIAFMALLALVE
jgi:hypothetical protein